MKGKQPTVYLWIIWRSLRLLQLNKIEIIWIISSFRKPRTEHCGKRKRQPDEFELRIIKTLEEANQPNRHLSFSKGIIPSLQNFKEEDTLEFQLGVLQLIANNKTPKTTTFPVNFFQCTASSFILPHMLGEMIHY